MFTLSSPDSEAPMVDLTELAKFVGKQILLSFRDGHVVRVKLVHVDAEEPVEIIYDVLQVVQVGPAALAKVKPGQAAAADPRELLKFETV